MSQSIAYTVDPDFARRDIESHLLTLTISEDREEIMHSLKMLANLYPQVPLKCWLDVIYEGHEWTIFTNESGSTALCI